MRNNEKMNFYHITDKVLAWQNASSPFHEAEALRLLSLIEKMDKEATDVDLNSFIYIKATLLSLLAKARFERIGELDDLTQTWMDKALQLNPENDVVNQVITTIHLRSLAERILPLSFPQIRETDHGNTKKKLAKDYLHIANTFFSNVPIYDEKLKDSYNAAIRLEDEALVKLIGQLKDVIQAIKKQLMTIVKATEAYSDSLNDIFYSQSQLQEIKYAIKEIESLRAKWEQLLPTADQSEEEQLEKNKALNELNQMIGLTAVKDRVHRLYHYLHYQNARKERGFTLKDEMSLNMILTGNPGTGKTTLARLLAKIYHELGLLERPEVLEIDRSHLVGSFVGQTEENTMNIIKKAVGGVLFIDEAYSLKREGSSGNDYGQTAIDTIVSALTSGELVDKFAVILAGYPNEIEKLLDSNPGLRSRLKRFFEFVDFSSTEIVQLIKQYAKSYGYDLDQEANDFLEATLIEKAFAGNGRYAADMVDHAIQHHSHRIIQEKLENDIEALSLLTKNDFVATLV